MFEIITTVIFVWLLVKAIGLAFKLTWGAAKVITSVLLALAVPVLIFCVLFVGGIALIVPIVLAGIAVAILKAVV